MNKSLKSFMSRGYILPGCPGGVKSLVYAPRAILVLLVSLKFIQK